MSSRVSRNVSLSTDLEQMIVRLVKSGRYTSASEVVRAGLRLLERDEVRARDTTPEGNARDARP